MLLNGQQLADREVLSTGNIIMDGNTIDFGGGENLFRIERGVISVAGGDDNLITGDNLTVEMDGGEIEARDDFIAGPAALALAAIPMSAQRQLQHADHQRRCLGQLQLRGRCRRRRRVRRADHHRQCRRRQRDRRHPQPGRAAQGQVEIRPINIGGTNGADVIKVAGVTGVYAESLLGSEAHYDAATGDIVINAIFGMGHLATAVTAATTMTQNWWLQSVGSYERRNPITLAKQ